MRCQMTLHKFFKLSVIALALAATPLQALFAYPNPEGLTEEQISNIGKRQRPGELGAGNPDSQ